MAAYHSREDGPREYDVTRDGQHFLMMCVDPPSDKPATLNVILNWPAELAGRASPTSADMWHGCSYRSPQPGLSTGEGE